MNNTQKTQIMNSVAELVSLSSQGRIAVRASVSPAMINHIVNKNWKLVSDEMWRSVAKKLHVNLGWQHAPTQNSERLQNLLKHAQEAQGMFAVSYEAGVGKSHTYKQYLREHKNVIYVECRDGWAKKTLVQELLKSAGIKSEARNVNGLIDELVDGVSALENPLIIIDQADRVANSSLSFLVDLYNELPEAGIVISGVDHLEKRIRRGAQKDVGSFKELFSRIGSQFVRLNVPTEEDVANICIANGLNDSEAIGAIYDRSLGDLRTVRQLVTASLKLKRVA